MTLEGTIENTMAEEKKYFRNTLGEFVYLRTYAKWLEDKGRRETWPETVDRYMDFMKENLGNKISSVEYNSIREAILHQEVMPSMRLMQFAGRAARKTNVCAYNCSFVAPSTFQDFGEMIYILMCGTGVGFSVEHHNVEALPQIRKQGGIKLPVYQVDDSREGWADAFVHGMKTWYSGKDVDFDFSNLRPAGARLYTMGGKSSGPDPLIDLLKFTKEKILSRQGRRLKPIDVHDICCKIGEIVVSGGVRRSALLSLSDLDDIEMREAKSGAFYNHSPHRSMANNSVAYKTKPSQQELMEEWLALVKSGSGERGLFNREGLSRHLPKRRKELLGDRVENVGTNPCGEILLQPKSFCNLTEIVARAEDTEESLLKKARIATILGTYQATLTNFSYLSRDWEQNCKEERLLGVSITGQWDSHVVREETILRKLKEEVLKINREYSKRFGINPSTCTTCTKPSGTVSQMVDSASGIHPRYAPYYIRRIRISTTDDLFKMLKEQGMKFHPEVGQTLENMTTAVLEFPVKAPDGAVFKDQITALEQLEYWKKVKTNYTEHNPSVTIYVGDDEWFQVGNWVSDNWDIIGGVSFLPRTNHVYKLAPYEEITKEKYEELVTGFPKISFGELVKYEKEDGTEVKKELACSSGVCEL